MIEEKYRELINNLMDDKKKLLINAITKCEYTKSYKDEDTRGCKW